jgi:hypothetical protein
MPIIIPKDPSAVLDYKYNWTDWLESGETISTHTIITPSGITLNSSSITDTGKSVTIWLSGGTAHRKYNVVCRITTSASRTDDRTMVIAVQER